LNAILLDTNAYVAFKRGHPEALKILQRAPRIAVNSVVLGELLSGFAVGTRTEANRRELEEFLSSPRVDVLAITQRTSEHYAAIFLALKTAGTPIPTNDLWIAASALEHGLNLFSYDAHFHAVQGLRVGMSLSDFEGGE